MVQKKKKSQIGGENNWGHIAMISKIMYKVGKQKSYGGLFAPISKFMYYKIK